MEISYNGVVLPYSQTSTFKQTAVRDESDTDRHLTEFLITSSAVVGNDYLAVMAPDLYSAGRQGGAASVLKAIRTRLLQDRKALSVKQNGFELLPALPQPGTVDADNGPKVQHADLTQLTNELLVVEFTVKARYMESNTLSDGGSLLFSAKNGPDVLYNRWTEAVEIDESGYSTRLREGKFKIRSDNKSGFIPDRLRSAMAVVSVPNGFVREKARYKVTADGLALEFSISDREVFKMPPFPAMKAEGYYRESCGINGAKRRGECYVRVQGAKGTATALLVAAAGKVLAQKLRQTQALFQGPDGVKKGIPQSAYCKVDLYQNVVEVYADVLFSFWKKRLGGINLIDANMVGTPGSEGGPDGSGTQPKYFDRGSAGLLLRAAAYYDPTLEGVFLGSKTDRAPNNLDTPSGDFKVQLSRGKEPGTAGKDPE